MELEGMKDFIDLHEHFCWEDTFWYNQLHVYSLFNTTVYIVDKF